MSTIKLARSRLLNHALNNQSHIVFCQIGGSNSRHQLTSRRLATSCQPIRKWSLQKNPLPARGYAQVVPWSRTLPVRSFPPSVARPEYADTGEATSIPYAIIKTDAETVEIERACRTAKTILQRVGRRITPGVTGEDIDQWVYDLCLEFNCYPSPLNYLGFPKCVTVSVNNIAVHAIPDTRPLEEGDIVKVDVSIYLDGFHGDCCGTFPVGDVDLPAVHLMKVARDCLDAAIGKCSDGVKLSTIGTTIETYVRAHQLNVIPNLCGHGLGRYFHEPPQVLHYDHASSEILQKNMIITIEPVVCEGSPAVMIHPDGWTVATVDGGRVAQFEEAILVGGPESAAKVLTVSLDTDKND